MNVRIQISLALLLAALAGNAAAELKIAVVEPLRAIAETNAAKKVFMDAASETRADEDRLRKLDGELRACDEKLKKDGALMGTAEVTKLKSECEGKVIEGRRIQQMIQKVRTEREQAVLQTMSPKLQEAINQIVKERGLDLVLHGEAAVHVSPALDITKDVTAKMNAAK